MGAHGFVASFVLCQALLVAQTLPELTARLAAAKTLDDSMIGDGGDKSETWRTYERWRAQASAAQLREFTKHESPIVRAYAVRALVETDADVDFAAIAAEHLLDTAKVTTFQGCCQAAECVGDVMLATLRPKMSTEQQLDLAEALVAKKSPLFAREWSLRTLRLRDGMLHTVRSLAENGDAAAAIALARYGVPRDAAILAKLLSNDDPFADNAWFLAAGLHHDPSLLEPLLAIETKARKRLESDNFYRLSAWLQAIAAQQSPAAATFLVRFLDETKTSTPHRESDVLDTMQRAIADQAGCAAFDGLRKALQERRTKIK